MGFNKIENFFKTFNAKICPKGAKFTKNRLFYKMICFLSFCYNQLVSCSAISWWKELLKLRRTVSNLSKSVHWPI